MLTKLYGYILFPPVIYRCLGNKSLFSKDMRTGETSPATGEMQVKPQDTMPIRLANLRKSDYNKFWHIKDWQITYWQGNSTCHAMNCGKSNLYRILESHLSEPLKSAPYNLT